MQKDEKPVEFKINDMAVVERHGSIAVVNRIYIKALEQWKAEAVEVSHSKDIYKLLPIDAFIPESPNVNPIVKDGIYPVDNLYYEISPIATGTATSESIINYAIVSFEGPPTKEAKTFGDLSETYNNGEVFDAYYLGKEHCVDHNSQPEPKEESTPDHKPEIENLKMRVFMTGLTADQAGYAIEELKGLLKYVAELESELNNLREEVNTLRAAQNKND